MAERAKLTKRLVEATAATGERFLVHDTELVGFRLCVGAAGSKAFYVRYRTSNGTIREPKIGAFPRVTVDEARRIAKDWLADVAQGGDPSATRQNARSAPTMADLFDRFLSEHGRAHKKTSSVEDDRLRMVRHLRPEFGRKKVADLTRGEVIEFVGRLSGTPIEANRCLALLSKAMNLAEMWDMRPGGTNPCKHVRRFAENKRRRFLSPKELGRLGEALRRADAGELGHVTWQSVAFVRLAIFTGMRRGEVLTLKWADVDTDRGVATLADSKTGFKQVQLPAPALEVLSRLPRHEESPYVLPGHKRGSHIVNVFKNGWLVIREAAELDDVHIHDLRHSFAAVGAGSGASLPIIGGLLGHRHSSTTARYAHLSDDPLKSAAEGISSKIAAALNAEPAEVVPLRIAPAGQ